MHAIKTVFGILVCMIAVMSSAVALEVLEGPYSAKVLDVIDGDTLAVRARIWLGTDVDIKVRLAGVDTPETRSRCPEEVRRARDARQALIAMIGPGDVKLRDVQYGKYAGRIVARVITPGGADLSDSLVSQGHARPYAGGRRSSWCQ